jgi:hypothetical protein
MYIIPGWVRGLAEEYAEAVSRTVDHGSPNRGLHLSTQGLRNPEFQEFEKILDEL